MPKLVTLLTILAAAMLSSSCVVAQAAAAVFPQPPVLEGLLMRYNSLKVKSPKPSACDEGIFADQATFEQYRGNVVAALTLSLNVTVVAQIVGYCQLSYAAELPTTQLNAALWASKWVTREALGEDLLNYYDSVASMFVDLTAVTKLYSDSPTCFSTGTSAPVPSAPPSAALAPVLPVWEAEASIYDARIVKPMTTLPASCPSPIFGNNGQNLASYLGNAIPASSAMTSLNLTWAAQRLKTRSPASFGSLNVTLFVQGFVNRESAEPPELGMEFDTAATLLYKIDIMYNLTEVSYPQCFEPPTTAAPTIPPQTWPALEIPSLYNDTMKTQTLFQPILFYHPKSFPGCPNYTLESSRALLAYYANTTGLTTLRSYVRDYKGTQYGTGLIQTEYENALQVLNWTSRTIQELDDLQLGGDDHQGGNHSGSMGGGNFSGSMANFSDLFGSLSGLFGNLSGNGSHHSGNGSHHSGGSGNHSGGSGNHSGVGSHSGNASHHSGSQMHSGGSERPEDAPPERIVRAFRDDIVQFANIIVLTPLQTANSKINATFCSATTTTAGTTTSSVASVTTKAPTATPTLTSTSTKPLTSTITSTGTPTGTNTGTLTATNSTTTAAITTTTSNATTSSSSAQTSSTRPPTVTTTPTGSTSNPGISNGSTTPPRTNTTSRTATNSTTVTATSSSSATTVSNGSMTTTTGEGTTTTSVPTTTEVPPRKFTADVNSATFNETAFKEALAKKLGISASDINVSFVTAAPTSSAAGSSTSSPASTAIEVANGTSISVIFGTTTTTAAGGPSPSSSPQTATIEITFSGTTASATSAKMLLLTTNVTETAALGISNVQSAAIDPNAAAATDDGNHRKILIGVGVGVLAAVIVIVAGVLIALKKRRGSTVSKDSHLSEWEHELNGKSGDV